MNRRALIEGYCAEGPAAGGAAAPPQSSMSFLLLIKACTDYAAVWALGVLKGGRGFNSGPDSISYFYPYPTALGPSFFE